MAQSKIIAYIPVTITVDVGELIKSEELSDEQIVKNITPNFIPYEDKMYVKVDRKPQVGDVVIINKFDGRSGGWARRVTELDPYDSEGFYVNVAIDAEYYFASAEDEYLAVYEPVKESGEHD
ncbi:hypothetical protein IBA56_01400 [Listeria seeligeri]|uniref:hypothetical protein n=1 Tax=Listeria seeligeri TaxID=1640 RepID=UPI001887939C|nr:hypothetical protein [Listeria seeligeri]MBF2604202.1 hypothetical protein [Listeria seeligeri]